jgi:DNA-directed RNA polymerase specialized sigma24 family protein
MVNQLTERDGRVMNHMDPQTKAVHIRLEAWGSWAKGSEVRAWPSSTLLGRIIEQGAQGAGQAGRPPTDMPDSIARIDAAVAKLPAPEKAVVLTYYVGAWMAPEVIARKHRISTKQLKMMLRRARWRVSGYLSAVENLE